MRILLGGEANTSSELKSSGFMASRKWKSMLGKWTWLISSLHFFKTLTKPSGLRIQQPSIQRLSEAEMPRALSSVCVCVCVCDVPPPPPPPDSTYVNPPGTQWPMDSRALFPPHTHTNSSSSRLIELCVSRKVASHMQANFKANLWRTWCKGFPEITRLFGLYYFYNELMPWRVQWERLWQGCTRSGRKSR